MIVMPLSLSVRAALGRRGAVVRAPAGRRRALTREVRAAVGVARVAAAVPEVVAAHLAGVRAGAGLVRELDQAGVVRRVVAQVVAVVPALGAAGGGTAGHVARRAVGAQAAVGDAVAVGLLVAHAVRPAIVAGARDLGRVLVGRRALRWRSALPASGPTHAVYGDVGLRVDREAARVAQAHRVDLGLGPGLRVGGVAPLVALEQVRAVRRGRGRERRTSRPTPGVASRPAIVGQRLEPQHLAVVVVGVARGPARVLVGVVRGAAVRARRPRRSGRSGTWRSGCCPSSRWCPARSSCHPW